PPNPLAKTAIAAVPREAGHHQITNATQPAESVDLGAAGDTEPADFDNGASDQRRLRLVAKSQSIANARRDRDDIFQSAPKFNPQQIRAGITPEARAIEKLLDGA